MQQMMHSLTEAEPAPEILAALRQGSISSFCLFSSDSLRSPAQARALTDQLQAAAAQGGQPPVLIGIDQEGGQLMAIDQGVSELPGNMALGATQSPELAAQAGWVLGRELRAMGINLNFAPALDVNINPANPVIGTRAFGDSPALVARLGTALLQGMQATGVLATAKHFPGHGDTAQDTHRAAATVPHQRQRLDSVELPPFQAAIEGGVAAIMTAHLLLPALDSSQPATLSARILQGLLREEMGFQGLIITDAMDMHAVAQLGRRESVEAALAAGADLILLGWLEDQLALARELAPLENPAAAARILEVRRQLFTEPLPLELVGCAEHQAVAQAIAEQSITLVQGRERLPLRLAPESDLLVISPTPRNLTPADTSARVPLRVADQIQPHHPRTQGLTLPANFSVKDISAVVGQAQEADTVIVGTINAAHDDAQAALVRALVAAGCDPIVVALRTPYDLLAFPEVSTYLCTYGIRSSSIAALVRVLFGEIPARGVLPCRLAADALQD